MSATPRGEDCPAPVGFLPDRLVFSKEFTLETDPSLRPQTDCCCESYPELTSLDADAMTGGCWLDEWNNIDEQTFVLIPIFF